MPARGRRALSTRPVLASFAGYRPGWIKGDVAAGLAIAAVGLPTRHRLSGDRRPAARDRPLRLDRAAGRLRGLRPVAPAHRRPRRRDHHGHGRGPRHHARASRRPTAPASPPMLALIVGGALPRRRGCSASACSRPSCRGRSSSASSPASRSRSSSASSSGSPARRSSSDGLIAPFLDLVAQGRLDPLALAGARGRDVRRARRSRRALRLPIPGPVIVVVLAVALSALLDLPGRGIAVVGDIPSGMPALSLPATGGAAARPAPARRRRRSSSSASPPASSPPAASAQRGGYPVDADREMLGFGAANIAAGLFARLPGHRLGLRAPRSTPASAAARSSPAWSRPRRCC